MARIRTVKPSFFTSADIVELTPLARLLYIGLWCEADRVGRLAWSINTWKYRYLPGDDCDIQALTNELLTQGLVQTYHVAGKDCAFIPTFCQHQVINHREAESQLPTPPEACLVENNTHTVDRSDDTENMHGSVAREQVDVEDAPKSATRGQVDVEDSSKSATREQVDVEDVPKSATCGHVVQDTTSNATTCHSLAQEKQSRVTEAEPNTTTRHDLAQENLGHLSGAEPNTTTRHSLAQENLGIPVGKGKEGKGKEGKGKGRERKEGKGRRDLCRTGGATGR